jgi:hypothetical protein
VRLRPAADSSGARACDRARERPEIAPADFDVHVGSESDVAEAKASPFRSENRRPRGSELPRARDEIGMKVRLEAVTEG